MPIHRMTELIQKLEANNFSMLPKAHACTAGLKALTTSAAVDNVEECRKLCGGHGYLSSCGLTELYHLYAAFFSSCIYEGYNTVLLKYLYMFQDFS